MTDVMGGDTRRIQLIGVSALALDAVAEAVARSWGDRNDINYGVVLCLLALCTTLPLALLSPRAAAVAISVATVLSLGPFDSLTVAGGCGQLVALYQLSRYGRQWLAAGLVVPFVVLALVRPHDGQTGLLTVLLAALAPSAAWAGAATRARREARDLTEARQLIDGTLLAHTARGERARIARELHDLVAHHISMIAVQAESARLTTDGMPRAGAQRLSTIADSARTALTEMRRLLGVLREDTDTDQVERRPQPGLRQLNELLDESRAASATGTRLILRGPPESLDPAVELAVFRIAQEALTNARRHAPGAAVDVELSFAAEVVRLRIRDNGPGPPQDAAAGLGLLGMRERAAAVGGRLSAGAAPGGGFLVDVTLPGRAERVR